MRKFVAMLLAAVMSLVLVMGAAPASAHLGSSGTCQASTVSGSPGIRYADWGCGSAKPNGTTSFNFSIDDRQHDHSCVYVRISVTGSSSWFAPTSETSAISSCGSPNTRGLGNDNVDGIRIYRWSPYGNNYRTLYP